MSDCKRNYYTYSRFAGPTNHAQVRGVFSTRKMAQEYADHLNIVFKSQINVSFLAATEHELKKQGITLYA